MSVRMVGHSGACGERSRQPPLGGRIDRQGTEDHFPSWLVLACKIDESQDLRTSKRGSVRQRGNPLLVQKERHLAALQQDGQVIALIVGQHQSFVRPLPRKEFSGFQRTKNGKPFPKIRSTDGF